ncbi:MAG: arylesterase [Methyloceanibacter sp.]
MMKPVAIVAVVAASLCFAAALDRGAAEPPPPVIVALGDSLTAGLGLPQDQAFPAQLEAALKARGIAANVVNAGVSGDTAAAGLARLDWSLPQDASAVIIELGANDALQGLPPEATKAALAAIIEKVQAKGLPILLAGMEAPRNLGKDYVEAFGAIYPDLAARYGLILYPFFLEGAALNDGLMLSDGLHPNAEGVAAIVANILPKVEELLAKVKSQG